MPREHTDRAYENELRSLRERVLLMGTKVEEMLAHATTALVERDTALAATTRALDRQVNWLEVEIDEHCLQLLAKRQPVASDLRLIMTALKLVTDLERIGDLAANICDRVSELNQEAPLPQIAEIQTMSEAVHEMVGDALDAFVMSDEATAQRVLERDDEVDGLHATFVRAVVAEMSRHPDQVARLTRLMSIAKYLERVADHATNIAERVIYAVKGRDVRHTNNMSEPGVANPRERIG